MTKGLSVVWSWWKKPNTNHGKRDANPHEGIPRTSHAPKWASPTAGRQPRALKKLNSPVVGLFPDVENVQWEHRYRHLPTTELPMSARRDGMNSDEVPNPQQKRQSPTRKKTVSRPVRICHAPAWQNTFQVPGCCRRHSTSLWATGGCSQNTVVGRSAGDGCNVSAKARSVTASTGQMDGVAANLFFEFSH